MIKMASEVLGRGLKPFLPLVVANGGLLELNTWPFAGWRLCCGIDTSIEALYGLLEAPTCVASKFN
jgi:hypothetical protein